MIKRSCLPILIALLLLPLPFVAAAGEVLRYAGATTLQHSFMPEAARVFKGETGVDLQIEGGNTNPGIRALLDGEVDMAGAGRHLTSEEKKQGLVEHFLGWDVFAVVVHKSNPVNSLTMVQLRDIFSGKVDNWKAVGGKDEKIIVVTSPKGSGMRFAMQDLILKDLPVTPAEVVSGVVGKADQQVALFPSAITGVSLSMVDHQSVKPLTVDSVAPTAANVLAKKYSMAKPLSLVTRGQPRGQLERFIAFAKGPQGQALLNKKFVADVKP